MKIETLRLQRVTQAGDEGLLLNDVNLHIFKGEILGLVCVNAHGLDALIGLLCQNVPIHYGFVYMREELVNSYRHSSMKRNGVAVIDKRSRILENLTVSDNLFVIRPTFRKFLIPSKAFNLQFDMLAEKLGIAVRGDMSAAGLTSLERCAVELIHADITGAKLVILRDVGNFIGGDDLPKFHEFISRYAEKGVSFLYACSYVEEAFQICERVALMENGEILRTADRASASLMLGGTSRSGLTRDWALHDGALPSDALRAPEGARPDAAMAPQQPPAPQPRIIPPPPAQHEAPPASPRARLEPPAPARARLPDGAPFHAWPARAAPAPTFRKTVLELKNIASGMIEDLSFSVSEGECLLLFDCDNAMTADLSMLMAGLAYPRSGELILNRRALAAWEGRRLRQDVFVIAENPTETMLFPEMSAIDNLCFQLERRMPFIWAGKRVRRGVGKEYGQYVGADITASDIRGMSTTSLYSLVYGKAHLYRPKAVFCVQPLAEADVYLRGHVLGLIRTLLAKGIAVVILAVNLRDNLIPADRLIAVRRGRAEREYVKGEFGALQ
jgi:ABC-type sugar transport system ATPase subunit